MYVYLVTFVFSVFTPATLTLAYELDPDILNKYLHTRNEVSRSRLSEVRAQIGETIRHTKGGHIPPDKTP